jgi:hypothetical protein
MATPTKEAIQRLVSLGYPESVAKRIAGGELPMDYASRMQRASGQGYDPTPYYSGYDAIRGVKDARLGNQPITDVTESLWASDNPLITGTYSASLGGGNIHPLLMRNPEAVMDAKGNQWQNLLGIDVTPENYSSQLTTNDFARASRESGAGVAEIQNVVDYGNKAGRMKNLYPDFEDLTKGGSNVRVDMSGNNTRSLLSAAFDPEYIGPNIMGSRVAPTAAAGLLGAGAMMAPENAEASPYGTRENFIAGIEEKLRPLPEPEPTIAPTENDTIGQIVNTVGDLFGGGYYDYRAAENLMNVADFLPYVGSGISLQQGADAYRQGKAGEGRLLTGLGLLEFIPVAGKIASDAVKARRAGMAANRSLDGFASRMSKAEVATRAPQTQEEFMRALGWQ